VGDVTFQQKCLGRMNSIAREGRTVLFVSHNMVAIRSLCNRAAFLDGGRLRQIGGTEDVISTYLDSTMALEAVSLGDRKDRTGTGRVQFTNVRIESTDLGAVIGSKSCLKITLSYRSESAGPLGPAVFLVGIYDYMHVGLYALSSDAAPGLPAELPAEGSVTVITEAISLTAGHCYVNLALRLDGAMADYVQHAASFQVTAAEFDRGGRPPTREWVLCPLNHSWSMAPELCASSDSYSRG
jgi:lipopolysaccharide transport system ATP-binding protein